MGSSSRIFSSGSRLLSPAQTSIWRAEVLHRHTSRWTQMTVVQIRGDIDPDRLQAAIEAVIARFPALRTRLQRQNGEVRQVFAPMSPFFLTRHQHSPEDNNYEATSGLFISAAQHSLFNLYEGPLFRAELLISSLKRYTLVICLHHIAADGVALGLLVPEIAAAYRGEGSSEPDLAYEHWLTRQEHVDPDGVKAASTFYLNQLAGASLRSEAIYDASDHEGWREPPDLTEATVTLDASICNGLRSLARQRGATLFIVLFAMYALSLQEFTKQEDLVLATFVSGRAGEPVPIIGSCINTLLVRVRLETGNSPAAVIDAVKEAWRPVRRWQAVPLTLLSNAGGSAMPLPQFAINFLDMNETSFEIPGLSASVTHAQQGFPLNDLLLYALREQDGRLRLRLIAGSGTPRLGQEKMDAILNVITRLSQEWAAERV